MKELSNHEKHIMMWDELARKGGEKWMTETASLYPSDGDCYACEESMDVNCKDCPIDWKAKSCLDEGTLYDKWINAESLDDRKKYAAIIRDLPWGKLNE